MLFPTWTRLLGALRGPANAVATRARRTPRRLVRLCVEALEDRCVPAMLIVTSPLDDGGAGTLRSVLGTAQNGDTIVFNPHLKGDTITLAPANGALTVGVSVAIQGLGANHLTISGGDTSRVFEITSGTVTISNLAIAHGQSTGLVIAGMGGGGGILNRPGAVLTLNADTLHDNVAQGTAGDTFAGGGLLNLGTATVLACTFAKNQVVGAGAGDAIGGSAGAGLANSTGGNLTVINSAFNNNTCLAAAGAADDARGGALDNDAGVHGFDPNQAKASTALVNNCTFTSNEVTGGAGGSGHGGAINNEGLGTRLTLISCDLIGNRSVGGDGVNTGSAQGGGGAITNASATLNVFACKITHNLALGGANAVISASGYDDSGAFGGGIENNFAGVLNIANSLIANNTAHGGAMTTNPGPGGLASGGGISNGSTATMTMSNCVVSGNHAIGGAGNANVNTQLAAGQQAGFAFGGGIDISNNSATATIINSLITANQASGGTGGNGYGGGIGVAFEPLAALAGTTASHLALINSTVAANRAVGGAGAAGGNGGAAYGGGLYVSASGSAILTSALIVHNTANGGAKGKGSASGAGHGGGVAHQAASLFTIDALTIIARNHASTSGNDVYLQP